LRRRPDAIEATGRPEGLPALSISGLVLALAVLGAGAADRTAQELRLLVLRLLCEAFRPARFAGAFSRLGLRRTIHRLPAGFLTVAIEAAVTAAISTTVAAIIVAVAVAALVAPEWTVVPVLAAVVLTLRLESLRLRLMHGDLWHLREVVAAGVIALLIAELVAALAFAHALAIAVQAIALLTHLLAIGHDDAAVVLGVLEIVLRQHRIAR
jgi:hypothetical protein